MITIEYASAHVNVYQQQKDQCCSCTKRWAKDKKAQAKKITQRSSILQNQKSQVTFKDYATNQRSLDTIKGIN